MSTPPASSATVSAVSLLTRAEELARATATQGSDVRAREIAERLEATVVRPLRLVGGQGRSAETARSGPAEVSGFEFEDALFALAADATRLCAAGPGPGADLLEACAGLHRLVADAPNSEAARSGIAHLRTLAQAIPTGPRGRVTVAADGPYLVTGPVTENVVSSLGEPLDTTAVTALCRCGRSGSKPWCDGTHARIGFSGVKRTDRVDDRLDVYEARQFEVTDNRGLCAHSGRCTDTLPTVFRAEVEPFVAPAGGRADDILRAVQACPSGALGVALEGRRAAEFADRHRDPMIEVSQDGPYRLTGGVEVLDPAGQAVERPTGSSPEHCSLCRCGHSSNKPFCSGAHWYANFRDPVVDPDTEPTLFAWAGGYPALLAMTTLFYERHVPTDELLAPLFARMEPDHPERVAAWLSEVFGGPDLYSRRYGGYARMVSQHIGKHLSEDQRARWVALLARSANEAGLPADPEFRAAFTAYLEWGSRIAVENSGQGAQPPQGMPVPKWWWVCNATPAARPSAQPSAQSETDATVETPSDGETVEFARHVRGMFRPRDRASMRSAFDLWDRDDVAAHAQAILARLRDGSMPCDGAWTSEQLDILARWIEDGCQP